MKQIHEQRSSRKNGGQCTYEWLCCLDRCDATSPHFCAAEARILISSIELIVFMKQINEQRSSRKNGGQCNYDMSDACASDMSDFWRFWCRCVRNFRFLTFLMQMRQKRQKSEMYDAPVSEASYVHSPPFFRELRCSLICFMKTIHSIEEIKIRAPAAQNVGPTFFCGGGTNFDFLNRIDRFH